MTATIERVRAVLRAISPDHITPVGRRMIEKVLDDEEAKNDAASYEIGPQELAQRLKGEKG